MGIEGIASRAIGVIKLAIAVCIGIAIAGLVYVAAERPTRGGEDYAYFASMIEVTGMILWISVASGVLAVSLVIFRLMCWRSLQRGDLLWLSLALASPALVLLVVFLQMS